MDCVFRFPKLGTLRTVMHRPLEGKPKTCSLKRDGDQWFVSVAMLRAHRPRICPEVERKLWGPHFWSPSYCAMSCGGAPLEIVKRYVEAQRGDSASSPP